jgi:uncharacterized protein (TIGR02466 family)
MNFEMFFPSPIWWEDTTDIDNDPILDLCQRAKHLDPEGRKLSNQGGWQSMDFKAGVHPELKQLEDKILSQAQQCVRDYGYVEEKCVVVIDNFWININGKNNSNSVHIHDSSFVSGVYYVKARDGQGNINFYKDYYQDYIIASQAPIHHYTPISASAISYPPRTGRLMFFPGSLPHGVESNQLDEERISIAFNVNLLRKDHGSYWAENLKRD